MMHPLYTWEKTLIQNVPQFWGAVVGAALSAVSSIADRKAAKSDLNKQNAYNDPAAVKERYEKAGVHPSAAFGGSPALSGRLQGTRFGSLISDALSNYQRDAVDVKALEIDRSRLELDRDKFEEQKRLRSLRPHVPGIYGTKRGTKNDTENSQSAPTGRTPTSYSNIDRELGHLDTRIVESIEDVNKVSGGHDLIHSRVGPLKFSALDEETSEMFGLAGEIAKPIVAFGSIPVHAAYDGYKRGVKQANTPQARLRDKRRGNSFLSEHYRGQDNFRTYRRQLNN